ncbi:MAG: SAM-dependent methyltransferase, partial [Chloroflexi bacterium]|nr:SAM-dependent methyltransferase [Chloroflexota bacterium]
MAFDQTTRNRLARFVSDARALLTEEFTRQLQNEYGLDPASGEVTPTERLTALDDRQRETARIIRETLDYYLAGNSQADAKAFHDVLDRIVREQAFTVLNRLCALRMSEARGLVLESIAKCYQSKGFLLYARLAGSALGETGESYRMYLFSLMDEFAMELPVLFDRFSPQGRLFPREAVLLKLLELINDAEIDSLWTEDETIGWIYQYFNSKEERKAMRDASSAPRNSRELAVRNQFFTPRYVVEFLTDNTLGRIWYEMTKGETALKDTCRYLVRRPTEIFLKEGEQAPEQSKTDENLSQEDLLRQPVYIPPRPLKDPREIKMLDPACGSMHFGLYAFDLFEQIYAEAWKLEERLGEDALQRLADLDSLHKTYPDEETYLKDVPRLIIERNIHGVDIDPRAVQIAGLSLWLRAQKSWQTKGLRLSERPQIRKSNVVCAEPM